MAKNSPNAPYNPYDRGLPATVNSSIWTPQGSPVAPQTHGSGGPSPRSYPSGTGTPMDVGPTCPSVAGRNGK